MPRTRLGWVVLIGNVNNSMALPEEPSAAFTGSKGVPWLAIIYTVLSLFLFKKNSCCCCFVVVPGNRTDVKQTKDDISNIWNLASCFTIKYRKEVRMRFARSFINISFIH